ncbi:MAG: hypothetical protein JWM80_845, partial [Cyanobacteria bacterium RYN_339]|nr:hypothetical protein [Cyanobacteria bacterium RYN_339]
DADPTSQWIGPGAGSWLSVRLSAPATGRVLVAWDGSGYHLLNTQAAPRTYAIEASTGSSDGRTGNWAQVFRGVDNPLRSRQDAFDAPGATWLRLRVESSWTGGPALRNLAVYELPPGPADAWLILGDSITAMAFDPSRPSLCATTVAARAPGHLPLVQAGGTGGDTAALGQQKLALALPLLPPGAAVGLAFGTNDATQGVPIATFKATMQAMIDQITASGRRPVLARTPYDLNGTLPQFVKAIDDLTAANRLPPGPDLYGWFKDHKGEIGPDTVHPTVAGQVSIQRLWGEAIARTY